MISWLSCTGINASALLLVIEVSPVNSCKLKSFLFLFMFLFSLLYLNGEGGSAKKKLTTMAWDKKVIYAEEIAVIVPISEAVLGKR